MRSLAVVILFLSTVGQVIGQTDTAKLILLVSSRVDTSAADVKSVIQLYENYYNAKPDSIYDNPFWNEREKKQYHDFDFSRESLFQSGMKAHDLFKYFTPFLLSVEPKGQKYQLRVLFSSTTTNPKYVGSKVWCIQKLNAVKQNDEWVLENLMVDLTEKWQSKIYGCITYVYPPSFQFNDNNALKSIAFCNDIIQRFNPTFNNEFKFYITGNIDDMGLLENFDYYFTGMTSGKAREGMILSAKGNEYYPHEFIHKLLPTNPTRGYVIDEGLAEFLGSKKDTSIYKKRMSQLATDLKDNTEKFNFDSVLSQSVRFNGYQTAYPAGAAICEIVCNICGDKGLIKLLSANTSDFKNMIESVCSITNLSKLELEQKWKEILFSFLHK